MGIRGAWHYTELNDEKFDVYAGVMAGYNTVDYSYKSSSGVTYSGGRISVCRWQVLFDQPHCCFCRSWLWYNLF